MEYEQYLQDMLDTVRSYGVSDKRVLGAMSKVPRHIFIPDDMGFDMEESYGDYPLPIGYDQTISQPFTVAFMLELLELSEGLNVLEIGAGSGWNSALIKQIVRTGKVTAIEFVPELADMARANMDKLSSFLQSGVEGRPDKALKMKRRVDMKAEIVVGDGSLGFGKNAPYDRIIATCACPSIPPPWLEQLKVGGIIVAPVGERVQELVRLRKGRDSDAVSMHGHFRFVPMLGKYGFD